MFFLAFLITVHVTRCVVLATGLFSRVAAGRTLILRARDSIKCCCKLTESTGRNEWVEVYSN